MLRLLRSKFSYITNWISLLISNVRSNRLWVKKGGYTYILLGVKTTIPLLLYRERILKTIKQRNKNFIQNIIVFLFNNFIWTNRKQVQFCVNKKTIILWRIFLCRYLSVFKIRLKNYLHCCIWHTFVKVFLH